MSRTGVNLPLWPVVVSRDYVCLENRAIPALSSRFWIKTNCRTLIFFGQTAYHWLFGCENVVEYQHRFAVNTNEALLSENFSQRKFTPDSILPPIL